MSQVCPKCHRSNRQGARFCNTCGAPLPPAQPATATGRLAPNTILQGRYIILGNVGRGGQAAVYRAADRQLVNKIWAIKEMGLTQIKPGERAEAENAFRQEAQILANLDHPGLPHVADSFSEGGRHYLVMDFIAGETLEDLLAQRGQPFSEAKVRGWALQICEILDYLHNQSPPIIYRDLKPSNVMIETATKRIKLIDLGTARRFKPGQAKDTVPLGTPGYAPPEQHNKKQTDARSDVYALGATLHHLVTGVEPVPHPTFEYPANLNPGLSVAFSAVIMRALNSDPAQRFQSAAEMAQALRGIAPDTHSSSGLGIGAGQACPGCGLWNQAGAIYCFACGIHMGAIPPAPPGPPPGFIARPPSPQPGTVPWAIIIVVGLVGSILIVSIALLNGCWPPPGPETPSSVPVTIITDTQGVPPTMASSTFTPTPTATATRRPTSTPIPTPITYRVYLPVISRE